MKTSITLIFLLVALASKPSSLALASNDKTPVLDFDSDPLQAGIEYFLVSAIWGAGGGGLDLGRIPDQKCPEIVIQRRSDLDHGLPVTFSNVNNTDEDIYENTNVNVEFVPIRDRLCTSSTIWKVDYDEAAEKWWVITDGVKDEASSSFKIKSNGVFGYKFNHCPSEDSCSDIGRYWDDGNLRKYWDDGNLRLGLNELGWPWVFIKTRSINQVVNMY